MEKKTTKKNNKVVNIITYAVAGLLILAGVVLLVSENTLFLQNLFGTYEAPPTMPPRDLTPITGTPEPGATEGPRPTDEIAPGFTPDSTPFTGVLEPVMVYFVKNQIQCPVEQVGLTSGGAIGTIDNALIAGWWRDSAIPGEPGNSIISGHVRYAGVLGYFSVLQEAQIGDEIIVKLSDDTYRYFVVSEITEYPYDQAPDDALSLGGDTRLTLITCSGTYNSSAGTHENRLYVTCLPLG